MYDQYTWIFAISVIVAFACAFGIGANDVANSFASSVSAKALTMFQAICVAAVCEFGGAVLLGAGVTDTIRSKIANVGLFKNRPDLLMYGFLAVMIAAAFWDNLSCHLELPVSTTHTTVGATVGMALVLQGAGAVAWNQKTNEFPFFTGISTVVASWFVSPIVSAIIVTILFGLVRTFVLRSQHSFKRAFYVLPVLVMLTFFVIVIFILQTNNKNQRWGKPLAEGTMVWISAVIAAVFGIITLVGIMPFLRKRIIAAEAEADSRAAQQRSAATSAAAAEEGKLPGKGLDEPLPAGKGGVPLDGNGNVNGGQGRVVGMDDVDAGVVDHGAKPPRDGMLKTMGNNRFVQAITYGSRYKVHNVLDTTHKDFDPNTAAVWEHAEKFDPKTEHMFRYLQVFSACVMSFAHGSNDIANAMGPFSGVYYIWETREVPTKAPVPIWILVIGGAGIVAGLSTYGYKIMRVLGVKSVKVTNARGFCLEISTAITVVLASRFGLPVSTTQVLCGALFAVGLFEGGKGLNWRIALKIFIGWVLTLIIAGFVSAAFTAWGVFSPQKSMTFPPAAPAVHSPPASG